MLDREIRELAEVARQAGVTELEVARDGIRVRLRRQPGPTLPASSPVQAEPRARPLVVTDSSEPVVRAPMVGYFFAGRRPGDPPCAQPGDTIQAGSRIGCVETMGTVTDVTSTVRGVVVEYLVSEGSAVEYGQPVLRLAVDSFDPDGTTG